MVKLNYIKKVSVYNRKTDKKHLIKNKRYEEYIYYIYSIIINLTFLNDQKENDPNTILVLTVRLFKIKNILFQVDSLIQAGI